MTEKSGNNPNPYQEIDYRWNILAWALQIWLGPEPTVQWQWIYTSIKWAPKHQKRESRHHYMIKRPLITVPGQEFIRAWRETQRKRRLEIYSNEGLGNRRLLLSIMPYTWLNCPGCCGLSRHTLVIVYFFLSPSNFSELHIDNSCQSFKKLLQESWASSLKSELFFIENI